MAYLEVLTRNQLQLVATSFILGLIFGAVYDIIRIVYILCGLVSYDGGSIVERKGKLPFCCRLMTDFAAALFIGLSFSVYIYAANDGRFRWFMAAFCAVGFVLWQTAASKPVLFLAAKASDALRALIRTVLIRPLCAVGRRIAGLMGRLFGLIRGAARGLAAATVGRAAGSIRRKALIRATERARVRLAEEITFDGGEGTRP